MCSKNIDKLYAIYLKIPIIDPYPLYEVPVPKAMEGYTSIKNSAYLAVEKVEDNVVYVRALEHYGLIGSAITSYNKADTTHGAIYFYKGDIMIGSYRIAEENGQYYFIGE